MLKYMNKSGQTSTVRQPFEVARVMTKTEATIVVLRVSSALFPPMNHAAAAQISY